MTASPDVAVGVSVAIREIERLLSTTLTERASVAVALLLCLVLAGCDDKAASQDDDAKARSGRSKRAKRSKRRGQEKLAVTFTLIASDKTELACAMDGEIAGLRCAWETKTRRASEVVDDGQRNAQLLQPVTTIDNQQFLVAGLWAQPDLVAKVAADDGQEASARFNVRCKLTVKGRTGRSKSQRAFVRWKPSAEWIAAPDWPVATASRCKIDQADRAVEPKPSASEKTDELAPGGPNELLLSCEEARKRYLEAPSAPGDEAPKLSAGKFGAVLNNGRYLNACGVPPTTAVDVCAAIQNGRAVGVTVRTAPVNGLLNACIRGQIGALTFPSEPRMSITSTKFAAE